MVDGNNSSVTAIWTQFEGRSTGGPTCVTTLPRQSAVAISMTAQTRRSPFFRSLNKFLTAHRTNWK